MAAVGNAHVKMAKDPNFAEIMKRTDNDVYYVGIGKETDELIRRSLIHVWKPLIICLTYRKSSA